MTTMKERISNVIAWVGFICLLISILSAVAVLWDINREKPKLIGQVSCEAAEAKNHSNSLFIENYSPSDCTYGATLYQWEYQDTVYGIVTLGDHGGYLFYADLNIDGYTHGIVEDIVESIVPWALPLLLISLVLNYILFGSARLLPWRKVVIIEETT